MANAIVANRDRLQSLAGALSAKKDYLAKCLPKHLTAERVIKVAIIAASRTPLLLNCTPESFVLSVVQASQLGLEAGSPLGEAYLVPYKDQCTLIVGYRGLIALARRSGEIEAIEAHVVHAKDTFELAYGLDAKLHHVPWMPTPPASLDEKGYRAWVADEADPGPMIAVYAVARLKGGARQAEVMTRAQVDAIRGRSRASSTGPWVSDYEEMAKKTVVRRLSKYLPMSIEMATAVDYEERSERGEAVDVSAMVEGIDLNAPAQLPQGRPSATEALKQNLRPVAAVAREPGGDDGEDDPPPFMPPTGSDDSRGGASNDADATGTARETAPSAGPVALAGPIAELARYLSGKPRGNGSEKELAEIVGAWLKRRDDLVSEGLGDEALDVVRTELRSRGCGDPDRFIQGVQRNVQKRTGT